MMETYCLNCLHTFRNKSKLKEHENACKIHDYCYIEMPKKESILKYNHGNKSMEIPFTFYADIDPLLEKINASHSKPEKSPTTKISKHTASGYSLYTHCSFDATKKRIIIIVENIA